VNLQTRPVNGCPGSCHIEAEQQGISDDPGQNANAHVKRVHAGGAQAERLLARQVDETYRNRELVHQRVKVRVDSGAEKPSDTSQ
jgi:hypothetical protein